MPGRTDGRSVALQCRRPYLNTNESERSGRGWLALDGAGKARGRAAKADGESAALEKIAAIPGAYRAMGVRLHAIIKASAPGLVPRVWYGMPAYARDGKVVCFFRGVLNERYMTLGFSEAAQLVEGGLWPTALALQQLGEAEEARISALVKRAAG